MNLLFSYLSTELTAGCVHSLKCMHGLLTGRNDSKMCFLLPRSHSFLRCYPPGSCFCDVINIFKVSKFYTGALNFLSI